MTKHPQNQVDSQGQAGIEVTPAMIEAGKSALAEYGFRDEIEYVIESVYRAMAYAKADAS